jgi:hypothetical protein
MIGLLPGQLYTYRYRTKTNTAPAGATAAQTAGLEVSASVIFKVHALEASENHSATSPGGLAHRVVEMNLEDARVWHFSAGGGSPPLQGTTPWGLC